MKLFKNLWVLSLSAILFSCNTYYNHIIESDYSYDGRFNKYDTFSFINNPNFSGTPEHKQQIEKFLTERLEYWGYKHVEKNPSLLINYNLFLEDGKFKGFTQPDFEYWIKSNYRENLYAPEDTLYAGIEKKDYSGDEDYNAIRYEMKDGTLFISMFDSKKKKSIWQGYASGVFYNENNINNERVMRHLVSRIMYEFRILAFKNS